MLKSPATAAKWGIVFNATWKKAVLLPMSTQILTGSSGHSFYSFPPSPIPFPKTHKQSYTHIISPRYLNPCECEWRFPATRFGFPASASRCQQKHDTLLTAVSALDTFLQNTTAQKRARAPLRKLKEKWHLHGFLQIKFTAPPACSKSPLLPPGQKKRKASEAHKNQEQTI